ncbi:THO complex subunit 5 homolog A-like [Watersipora subatra]|uniref:THO complex subunit 5 homolog A-like n=1 Tax=Watersipora subatra TaxID=2589382 RepID=UPI00355C8248
MTDQAMFNLEVEQSESRNQTEDLKTFKEMVKAIMMSLSKIRELKQKKNSTALAEISEQRTFTSLLIAKLRKLNRLSHLTAAKGKEMTSKKRSKNDEYHLQLENLQYEVSHLKREINKCLEFRSRDEELTLVSLDEFYSKAPEDISRPEVTRSDGHEQRKSRLQWEMEQRKQLSKQLEESRELIGKSQAEIESRERQMDSLVPKLGKILEATRPVQEFLGMPFEHQREQHQLARYLPQPLYLLHRYLYSVETHGMKGTVKVLIGGDVDAAKSLLFQSSTRDADSESDEDEGHAVLKHRQRMNIEDENSESSVLKKHPLQVSVEVSCTRTGSKYPCTEIKVLLSFSYLTNLNIVTVTGSLIGQMASMSTPSGDLMQLDGILSCIQAGDKGDIAPTPFSQYQLDKLSPSNFAHYQAKVGKAYKWAQDIAGLSMPDTNVTEPKLASLASILKKIKKMVLERAELLHQITDLERCNLAVPFMKTEVIPKSLPLTALYHWSAVSYKDICLLPQAQSYIQGGVVNSDCLICLVKLACDSLNVQAHVIISRGYPSVRPILIIRLEHQSLGTLTHLNSPDVKAMESELNIGKMDKTAGIPNQLNLQIVRLGWCCDVFVAANALMGPQQRKIEVKFMPNYRKGKDRQLPFTYNADNGFFGHD